MVSLVKGVGIGTAVGAGLGALSSDDGYGIGALRGGIAGAGAGALAHGIPRGIDAAYKSSGLTRPREGLLGDYARDAIDSFKGTYDSVNNDQNKALMKSFTPGVKKAAKTAVDDRDFSLKMIDNMAANVKSFSQKDIETISNLGMNFEKDLTNLSKKSSTKELGSFLDNSMATFRSASTSKKVGLATAAVTDAGINSVRSHLIDPTINMFGKIKRGDFRNIEKHELAATAFNAWGGYEMGEATTDISNGDYGSALGTMAMMGAGKLAYSQGANLIKVNSMLKERGMTWGGVAKAGVGGVGANKFANGVKAFTPEDQLHVMNTLKSASNQF